MRPRRWTVGPTTDRRSRDGQSVTRWTIVGVHQPQFLEFILSIRRRTIVPLTVRPAQPSTVSEPLLLIFYKINLSVCQQTLMTDCHPFDGLSCETIDGVKTFVSKFFIISSMCPTTEPYDGPS